MKQHGLPSATCNAHEISVNVGGRNWILLKPGELESLWDRLGEDGLDRIPYWVELWPASLGLAEWLVFKKREIVSETCLDLGCGMGLTAIVGQWLGANVLGCDYEMEALKFACVNSGLNNVPSPLWLLMDWSNPAILKKSLKFAWAADIAYEKRFWLPILALLDHCLAEDGRFWLAEPGRVIFVSFLEYARERGWQVEAMHRQKVLDLRNRKMEIIVTIWQFMKKPL